MIKMEEIKQRIIAGGSLTAEEALSLLTDAPFEALCQAAHEITEQCAPRVFDMCSIINAKSGRCPENCKWCAQSAHHNTRAENVSLSLPAVAGRQKKRQKSCVNTLQNCTGNVVSRFVLLWDWQPQTS